VAGDLASRRAARSFSSLHMAACHAVADGLGNSGHEDADRVGAEPDHIGSLTGLNLERSAPRAAAGLMQSPRNKAPAGTLIAARGSVTANSSFEVQATSWALIRTAVYEAWMRDTC
jgi:hypothetical protein